MKKYLLIIALSLGFAGVAVAAPSIIYQRTVLPELHNTYDLGSSGLKWRAIYTGDLTVTGSCTGCGGSGGTFPFTATSYGVSTSTLVGFTGGIMTMASSTFNGGVNIATLTGILKATAGAVSTATDGSDYLSSSTGVKVDQTVGQTIGATGARLTKLWATDITVTNAIAGSITGNAATVTTNANLTGPITSSGNATSIASQTGTGTTFVTSVSPTITGTLTYTNITGTNATSTGKLNIPNGSAPSVVTTGDLALDTTSDQLIGFGASSKKVFANGSQYASFIYATTTSWTATTTLPLGPAFIAETWNSVQCFTDAGTLNVSFYDGTNRMNMFNASTTVGTVTLSTNNTFVAAEKRYVDVGTPASSPLKIACTVNKSITAD